MILIVFIIVIFLLIFYKNNSNYISTDVAADYNYTFVNIGYDIAGVGYTLIQAPGDVDKSAADLNYKIWTNAGSIGGSPPYTPSQIYGVRKELLVGGHGMVEYIIATTPPSGTTTTVAIDKVIYNSNEYVIPDHIIVKKSKVSPVLFTCPPGQGTVTGDTCVACTGSQWSDGTAPCAAATGPTTCPAGHGFTAATASNDRKCTACTGIQYSVGGTNACANWSFTASTCGNKSFTPGSSIADSTCVPCSNPADGTTSYYTNATGCDRSPVTVTTCSGNQQFTAATLNSDGTCTACSPAAVLGSTYYTSATGCAVKGVSNAVARCTGNRIITLATLTSDGTCSFCSPVAVLGTTYYINSTGCSYTPVTAASCSPGGTLSPATLNKNNSCTCNAGYYGTNTCSICPTNTTSLAGTTTIAGCTPCTGGQVSSPGTLGICKTCTTCTGTINQVGLTSSPTYDQIVTTYSAAGADLNTCTKSMQYKKNGSLVSQSVTVVSNPTCS
jgi:hypothetical protein